ncbi:MAG: bi-domain-containing oxidoreductase [Alphaproteobacteria bacterium]
MRQVLQSLKTGDVEVMEVPAPMVRPGHVLIRSRKSLISAGTERMMLDFGRANLIDKARQQPEKVRQTLDKVRTDGVGPTLEAVRAKLDQPFTPGYCNMGEVIAVGPGVDDFAIGDRVVSNGPHAEVVCVPRNLCAKVPEGIADEDAAFTVLGAIALQGVRLVAPTLGERIVVIGLGLVGLVTVQLLRANGCAVLGADFNGKRVEMARMFGAETVDLSRGQDLVKAAEAFSQSRGVDGVLVTASTKSNDPMRQAVQMSRKRGRVVLVGVAGLELNRTDLFQTEVSVQVSCSYGPGRYDPSYEDKGQDYPFGFVRWTEQRNFEAVLDLLDRGALDFSGLVSHRIDLAEAAKAYEALAEDAGSLAILLDHGAGGEGAATAGERIVRLARSADPRATRNAFAVIGAGNYASRTLIPALGKAGARLHTLVSENGVSAGIHGRKAGFEAVATDAMAAIEDPAIGAVVIATRHDSHARYTEAALRSGKSVFVEKPLALQYVEIDALAAALKDNPSARLMVGFNRRFARDVARLKGLLDARSEPLTAIYTVNAGAIPATHWTQDPDVGGGRIIGEACHFIDLIRFLTGAPMTEVHTAMVGAGSIRDDKAIITLSFEDGSIGTVCYFANGAKSYPKERLEVFCGGKVAQIDNFRKLTLHGWSSKAGGLLGKGQDKGQDACMKAFVEAVTTGGPSPIPEAELFEVARRTLEAAGRPVNADQA